MDGTIELDGLKYVARIKVDQDTYTEFMASLEPDQQRTPTVSMEVVEVQPSFRSSVIYAFCSLKHRKAPRSDLVRVKISKVEHSLFVDALHELWSSACCLDTVTDIECSIVLSPIYKDDGESNIGVSTSDSHRNKP